MEVGERSIYSSIGITITERIRYRFNKNPNEYEMDLFYNDKNINGVIIRRYRKSKEYRAKIYSPGTVMKFFGHTLKSRIEKAKQIIENEIGTRKKIEENIKSIMR